MNSKKISNLSFYGGLVGFFLGLSFAVGFSWLTYYQYNHLADTRPNMERKKSFVWECLFSASAADIVTKDPSFSPSKKSLEITKGKQRS